MTSVIETEGSLYLLRGYIRLIVGQCAIHANSFKLLWIFDNSKSDFFCLLNFIECKTCMLYNKLYVLKKWLELRRKNHAVYHFWCCYTETILIFLVTLIPNLHFSFAQTEFMEVTNISTFWSALISMILIRILLFLCFFKDQILYLIAIFSPSISVLVYDCK